MKSGYLISLALDKYQGGTSSNHGQYFVFVRKAYNIVTGLLLLKTLFSVFFLRKK